MTKIPKSTSARGDSVFTEGAITHFSLLTSSLTLLGIKRHEKRDQARKVWGQIGCGRDQSKNKQIPWIGAAGGAAGAAAGGAAGGAAGSSGFLENSGT